MLHRHVVLLVLASSSFRVSSSGHVLYYCHRRHRVLIVIGIDENRTTLLLGFYFSSFQKFLSVGLRVAELHLGLPSAFARACSFHARKKTCCARLRGKEG